MSDSARGALVASMAAGYLLGRSGKAKLALTVASYLASKKLRAKPQELLAIGAGKLSDSPQLAQLTDQVRGELLSVGREALKAVADRKLAAFADSLAERTKSLGEAVDAVADEVDEEVDEDEEEGGEEPEDEGEEPEDEEEEPAAEDRPRKKSAPSERSRREPARRSAPAKKTAKKAPPEKAAKKTAKKSPAESRRRR